MLRVNLNNFLDTIHILNMQKSTQVLSVREIWSMHLVSTATIVYILHYSFQTLVKHLKN